jgi:nucleotide-binding universal stress UspA family protein
MPELALQRPFDTRSSDFQFAPRMMLFVTDFSRACQNAWPYALAIAHEYHSKLLLVHVIDPVIFASVPSKLAGAARELVRREKEDQLKLLQRSENTPELDFELLLREGGIADILLRIVQERGVELLVAGTRGRSRTERLLLGSFAEKLFRQAGCPSLFVPERASFDEKFMIRRILCPIDFSPDSRTALAFATSIARRHGAQLILMHVLRDDLASRKSEKEWVVHHAQHQLRKLLDRDNNLPFETLLEITVGVVPEQISRTATEYHADVVIISVHPAAGTVAHERERNAYKTIRWSRCAILTVPRSRHPMVASNSLTLAEH